MLDEQAIKLKTKAFALQAIRLVESLPHGLPADELGRRFLQSATTLGVCCRSAYAWQSAQDQLATLEQLIQTAEECLYWLELLMESGLVVREKVDSTVEDVAEILSDALQTAQATYRAIRTEGLRHPVPPPNLPPAK